MSLDFPSDDAPIPKVHSELYIQEFMKEYDTAMRVLLARLAEWHGSTFWTEKATTDLQESFQVVVELLTKYDEETRREKLDHAADLETLGVSLHPILTDEDRAKFPIETQAYWKFVRTVLRTSHLKYPLAKIAWDFGVEWGRNNPKEIVQVPVHD